MENNFASTGRGGALHICSGPPVTLTNCQISGNRSNGFGGAIRLAGALSIKGTSYIGNQALNNDGGAIHVAGASSSVTFDSASSVIGNTAVAGVGGGISNLGTVALNGADVRDNVPDDCAPPGLVPGCVG